MNARLRVAIPLAGLLVITGLAPLAAQTLPGPVQALMPAPAPKQPVPPAPAPLSAAQARDVLATLNDPQRRAAFAATLEAIVKAMPVPPVPPTADAASDQSGAAPAAADQPATPDQAAKTNLPLELKPDSLGRGCWSPPRTFWPRRRCRPRKRSRQ